MTQRCAISIGVMKNILDDEGNCSEPISFNQLFKKYESTTWKTGFGAKWIRKGIIKELETNETLDRHFTIRQLVHLHFLLSIPVPDQSEAEMRNAGALELDEYRRIVKFKSSTGRFKRAGIHPPWAARIGRGNNDETFQDDSMNEEAVAEEAVAEEAVAEEPASKRRKTRSRAPEPPSSGAQNQEAAQNALPPVQAEATAQNPRELLRRKTRSETARIAALEQVEAVAPEEVEAPAHEQIEDAAPEPVEAVAPEQVGPVAHEHIEAAALEEVKVEAPEQVEDAAPEPQIPEAQNPQPAQNARPTVKVEAPAQNLGGRLNEVKAEIEDQDNDPAPEMKPDVAIINEKLLNSLKNLITSIDSPSLETLKSKILLAITRNNVVMIPEFELLSSVNHCFKTLSRGASLTNPNEESIQFSTFMKLLHLTLLQLGFDEDLDLLQEIQEKSKQEKWLPMGKVAWAIEAMFYTATPAADN